VTSASEATAASAGEAKSADAPPGRTDQWRLFYSSIAAGSFGYEANGKEVPCASDEACEFATPGRGGSTYYSSSTASTSSSATDEAKLESRMLVLEWQAAAFGEGGAYKRDKVEKDEADKFGVVCGQTPAGERGAAGGVELEQCLEKFSEEEALDAENTWYCDKCKEHRQATKKLQIWSLPPVLVLHIKRFSAQGMWRRKNDTPVNFPYTIDLRPFVLHFPDDVDTTYELQAVSNHYGSTGGGHYTAFAKHSETKVWHKFDDSHTAVVDAKDVVTAAAYVLIYVRRGFHMDSRASPEV
jgi:hypothetical protein